MNQELYDRLMDSYRLTREQNAREEARRRDEAKKSDPELARLMDERHQMILTFGRAAIQKEPAEDLTERMREYNRQIRERLMLRGFPPDWLEPVYTCPKCRDTGLMGEEERFYCDCFRKKVLELTDTVGTGKESFEAFDETVFPQTAPEGMEITQREEMRRVRAMCEKYADQYPFQQPADLLLYGSSGLGKSYLMCCIARRLREKGADAELISSYDVIRLLRDAYFGRQDETDRLFNADVLLVDDLGMEPMMENVTLEQLFHLISVRRSRSLPMVFSTNLTMSELKKRYSERISSRLLDATLCRVIPLKGRDIRLIRRDARE